LLIFLRRLWENDACPHTKAKAAIAIRIFFIVRGNITLKVKKNPSA
jgi:hypothetical protein